MSADLSTFSEPLVSGYKQAIYAKDEPGMWTPFVMMGPGVKKNNFLGDTPFPLVDQYPTIMKALNQKIPDFVQGKSLPIFKDSR
jgi:arylsulfatase A-like enzyme